MVVEVEQRLSGGSNLDEFARKAERYERCQNLALSIVEKLSDVELPDELAELLEEWQGIKDDEGFIFSEPSTVN